MKKVTITITALLAGILAMSCTQAPRNRAGYAPVVNKLPSKPGDRWLLTEGSSFAAAAQSINAGLWKVDSCQMQGGHTHFFYRKADSVRHIITYQNRIVSDKRRAAR
jgi:hypothetical protein